MARGTHLHDRQTASYYDVLGISARSEPVVIAAAYRALIKKYHPDSNAGDAAATEQAKLLNEAFRTLGDEAARARYDRALRVEGSADRPPARLRKRPASRRRTLLIGLGGVSLAAVAAIPLREAMIDRSAEVAEAQPRTLPRQLVPSRRLPTTAWLVGRWAMQQQPCTAADLIIFGPDKRWSMGRHRGRWQIRGRRLFLTSDRAPGDPFEGTPWKANQRLSVRGPMEMSAVGAGGVKRIFDRCPPAQDAR